MEDIRGSRSVCSNNSVDNSGDTMQVQSPPLPLPAQLPTDSETTMATSDDRSSDGSRDDGSSDCDAATAMSAPPTAMAAEATALSVGKNIVVNHPTATASASLSCAKPPPEEHRLPQPLVNHNVRPLSSDDDYEMEIGELDFSNNGSCEYDPAVQIKVVLSKLVFTAKRRKKRLEELRKKQQNAASAANTEAEGVAHENHAADAGTGNHHVCTSRKPSLKQRPVQVIMTWMDSFQDNEKIQQICLQSLPAILEDPPNRLAAQAEGLASIVLYNMAAFPTNSLLQLTAFHTLVVLLRPLGANEGMVNKAHAHSHNKTSKSSKGIRSMNHKKHHHTTHGKTSINATHNNTTGHQQQHNRQPMHTNHSQHMSSILKCDTLLDARHEPQWEENGVRVMLDSLRRFSSDRYLQAMGCWAFVNAALYPSLKTSLLRLGGVYTVTNAMMLHPNVEAVQFRGLFALINLIIPGNKKTDGDGSSIHSHIYQIARLTIVAMRNFYTNKSILNRGCLVLRNLSLTPAFVKILARTPGCVDMLLHCRQVCPRDVLVQRSARTIMVLLQRITHKEISGSGSSVNEKNTFKLTQRTPALSSASIYALSSLTSSDSTPSEEGPPKL